MDLPDDIGQPQMRQTNHDAQNANEGSSVSFSSVIDGIPNVSHLQMNKDGEECRIE